jgi:hypothetical protein
MSYAIQWPNRVFTGSLLDQVYRVQKMRVDLVERMFCPSYYEVAPAVTVVEVVSALLCLLDLFLFIVSLCSHQYQ